jgi:hypothetical protein
MTKSPNRSAYDPPEGDHYDFMIKRRAEAPWLFNPNGTYKNFVHIFTLREDGTPDKMVSIDPAAHIALPCELELLPEPAKLIETLDAYYNIGAMTQWHPSWRRVWKSVVDQKKFNVHEPPLFTGSRRAYYSMILGDPSVSYLASWFVQQKRTWRQMSSTPGPLLISKKTAEQYLRAYQVFPTNLQGV